MNNKELNKTLKTQARSLGLCDEWYDAWKKNESMQELIEKYLRGIDFCIKHDYPSLDFARANFTKDILVKNGIFLDDYVDAHNVQKLVLLGESKGIVFYNESHSGEIYIRHQSELEVVATEGTKIFIETYEQCKLRVTTDRFSKVFVYRHGGEVKAEGNVIIRNKIAEQ